MFRADLTTLRLFLTVCTLGNISKASEHEHIAPSAISKRIQALEAEIGTQLFYRHARGVAPTPAGRTLAEHARKLFENLNLMTADISSFTAGQQGEVRIHAHSSSVIQYLPQDLARFVEVYPHVEIRLREQTSADALQSLMDGVADIGICDGNVAIPAGLKVYPYVTDTLVALCPIDHCLAGRDTIRFADIRDIDLVSLDTDSTLHALMMRAAETDGFELKTRIEVHTFEAAVRMVEHGLGIAVLPANIIRMQADTERAKIIALSDAWSVRKIVLCTKGSEYLTQAARLMLEHLRTAHPAGHI